MTPVEIFEYKSRWIAESGGNPVTLHSDYRSQGIDYCKKVLSREQWDHKRYTNVYEDTFYFESDFEANAFQNYFKKM